VFKRPNIFLSEVASSIASNTDCLSFFPEKVQRKLNQHVQFQEFEKFDSKREGYTPNAKDLKRLLENVSKEEKGRAIL